MKLFSCKYLPLVTAACGVVGFAMRTALDLFFIDEKGLYMTQHPLYIGLFVFSALFALWLFLTARKAKPVAYEKQFAPSWVAFGGCVAAAAGILATDCLELIVSWQDFRMLQNKTAEATLIISAVCFVVGVLAAAALVLSALLQRKGKRVHFAFYSVLAVYLMVHPLSQYRMWSSDPQVLNYIFHLLASVILLLAVYHRAALDAGKTGLRRYVLLTQLALFFCCISIQGDSWAFYLAMALWLVTNTGRLYIEEEI